MIRPDVARLDDQGPAVVRGIYKGSSFRGSRQKVTLQVNQLDLNFDFPSAEVMPKVGTEMVVSFDPRTAIKIYPA